MRIGIDAHMLGDHSGGNESFYDGVLGALDTNDENEYYLFVSPDANIDKYENRFRIVRFRSKNAVIRNFVELTLICVKYKLDVLHTQYYVPFIRLCRTVVTIHDISFEHYRNIFTRGEYLRNKLLIPYAARSADRIITVSEFCKKDISSKYKIPESKITVVYNAVDADFKIMSHEELQEIAVREKFEIGNNPYLLCVGNLQPRKNIPRLIRAFMSYIEKTGSDVRLVIVGKKAWLYDEILSLAEGTSGVIMTGYVEKKELVALLNEARGFIYPSFFEGFGIPPLEALACGTNVAVSDIPVMHEIVEGKAIFFDPMDENDIADKIKELLSHSAVSEKYDSDKLTWNNSAEQMKSVYESK